MSVQQIPAFENWCRTHDVTWNKRKWMSKKSTSKKRNEKNQLNPTHFRLDVYFTGAHISVFSYIICVFIRRCLFFLLISFFSIFFLLDKTITQTNNTRQSNEKKKRSETKEHDCIKSTVSYAVKRVKRCDGNQFFSSLLLCILFCASVWRCYRAQNIECARVRASEQTNESKVVCLITALRSYKGVISFSFFCAIFCLASLWLLCSRSFLAPPSNVFLVFVSSKSFVAASAFHTNIICWRVFRIFLRYCRRCYCCCWWWCVSSLLISHRMMLVCRFVSRWLLYLPHTHTHTFARHYIYFSCDGVQINAMPFSMRKTLSQF